MAAEEGSGCGGGCSGGDRKSSPAPTKPGGSGAAKFLAGMPSRGNFSSGSVSSSLGGFRVYVCEHSTDPPEGQIIQTDSTNILIRHLQLNKQKSEAKDSGSRTPGETTRGKRSAARSLDVNNSAKRANLGTSSGSSVYDETISGFLQHTLQSFIVERLRALLRQSGLSTKGKKSFQARYIAGTVVCFSRRNATCPTPSIRETAIAVAVVIFGILHLFKCRQESFKQLAPQMAILQLCT